MKEKEDTDRILDSVPLLPHGFDQVEGYNPMVVMFLNVLNDRELDTSGSSLVKQKVSLCAVYLNLMMLLFKQSAEAFCKYVRSFGRIVFNGFKVRNSFLNQQGEVSSLTEAGLLVRDAGGGLKFVYGSLELFLSVLYLILMLDDGKNIDMLLDNNSVMFTNPLLLYFCLAFLKNQCNLPLVNRERVYQDLINFVTRKFDNVQLDLIDISELYPTLSYASAKRHKDELVLGFLNDVLSGCRNAEVLLLNDCFPVCEILSGMAATFSKLKSIMYVN